MGLLFYFWCYLPLLHLPFLLLVLSPFVIFDNDNPLISCPHCKSKTLWNIFMICRTGPDDVSRTRLTTLPFLLLALSPFVMSDSDYPLILCPLCKSKTLWNIFMILGSNVEQDQTTCCALCLSCFWRYLPLLSLTVIIH